MNLRIIPLAALSLALLVVVACGGNDTSTTGGGGQGGGPGSSSSVASSSSASSTSSGSSSSTSSTSSGSSSTTSSTSSGSSSSGQGGGGQGGGGGGMNVSAEIAVVIAAPDGGGLSLPVNGAFVTYLKPVLGLDVAGFFVQGAQSGPAVFVAVDPGSLSPVPAVGDKVNFVVTDVATQAGLKQVTGITGFAVASSANPIAPLVTDVSAAADLVSNLGAYESRAIKITGTIVTDFLAAGAPQVAAQLTTVGLTDTNLRLRVPDAVRAQYDLQMNCAVTVDYGVMWRFNAVAQPSALYGANLTQITCPAPTVIGAAALSPTEVVVSFDRSLDPATVDAADFTFDQGLTASAVSVAGADVTVTTSAQTGGLAYTVMAANLTDVLGTTVGLPDSAMFLGYVPLAQLRFNEINPNITTSRDLLELLVVNGGSTGGIKLIQEGSATETLATFPDVSVSTGDIIVVHLNPAAAMGAAPGSETMGKAQYPSASFSANYDTAWDFHGGVTGLTFSNRVLRVDGPGNTILDAIPVVLTGQTTAAFPVDLQALQTAGLWFPADCGGSPCTYMTMPTAVEVSVNYVGAGNSPIGNSISRKPGADTKQKADWNAAGAQSFGLPNP